MGFGLEHNLLNFNKKESTPEENIIKQRANRPVTVEVAQQYESLANEIMSHHKGMSHKEAWTLIRKAETTNGFVFFDGRDQEINKLVEELGRYDWGINAVTTKAKDKIRQETALENLANRKKEVEAQLEKLRQEELERSPEELRWHELKALRALRDIGIATKFELSKLEELEAKTIEQKEHLA